MALNTNMLYKIQPNISSTKHVSVTVYKIKKNKIF